MSAKERGDGVPEREAPAEEPEAPAAEAPAEDWRDLYLRTLAELDNFRKRVERDRDQARLYAVERLVRDLLPVLDSLEMACASQGDAEAIREGVSLALQEALRLLADRGLAALDATGETFDPRVHEAAETRFDAGRPAGTVLEVLRKGYKLHDRLLRPARVAITTKPPSPATCEEGGGEEAT